MEWRNPKYTISGQIDCEILHPSLGWIPTTVDPSDTQAYYNAGELFLEILNSGVPISPPSGGS